MATFLTLANFNGANGSNPDGGIIVDANGDLFGTTPYGGASGYGTVFEIVKTGSHSLSSRCSQRRVRRRMTP